MARLASKPADVSSSLLRAFCLMIFLDLFAASAASADPPQAAQNKNSKSAPVTETFNPDALKPYQTISFGPPPLSPTVFDPDPGIVLPTQPLFTDAELTLQLRRTISRPPPPQPPELFNPDLGAAPSPPPPEPFFRTNYGTSHIYG